MRIFFVRHGQTFSNVEHLMDTLPPGAELTPRGRDQATAVGIELAELSKESQLDACPRLVSSVAIRAQQTAMLAARAFEDAQDFAPHSIPVEPMMGLQEIYAGDLEMSGSEDAHREYTVALRGWVDGDLQARMPGGETLEQVLARFRPLFEDFAAGERDVVVFSHGAAIRTITAHACGVDPDFAFTGYIANCRFTVLEPEGRPFGQWTLRRWADLSLD